LNSTIGTKIEIFYWKEGSKEVDFVLRKGDKLVTIEIANTQKKRGLYGITQFSQLFRPQTQLVIGGQGIPLDEFLLMSVDDLV